MSVMRLEMRMDEAVWAGEDDERALVERAKRDRAAFSELYRRHYRGLCAHVYRRTGDVHATEDVVSEVFLTALRTLPRFRYRGVPVRFWLLRIATNAVNRWARRRRRRGTTSLRVDELTDARADDASLSGEADDGRARRALLTLAPKHQAVLSLHYLEGLSVKEVASIIGCREGTVKSRLARARDALRVKLNGRR